MAWPDDRDLPVEVEAAFGADLTADPGSWSWTDLSARLRSTPISLRAGKSGGAGRVSPGTCSATLDNDDSALTPLHPLSPYWPNVELGTPVRVRIRRAEDAFARTTSNGWGVADSGQAWTPSSPDFSTAAGVARHSHPTVNILRRTTLAATLADSEQMVDVAPSTLLTGAALVTGFLFRYQNPSNYYWLRTEFNAGGTSVMLKISKVVGGTFTDLATLNPVPGVPYAAGSYLRVRASVVGSRLAMKVWSAAGAEPAGWTLTATDSSLTAAGATGLQSWVVSGNTNTLPVEARYRSYTARVDRFSGFADQWEPTYLPTGVVGQMSSAVRITASGILRRLEQGDQPDESPLRRTIAASNPVAYYPAEDGNVATAAGSAVSGENPLVVSGAVEFTPVDDFTFQTTTTRYGTSALADLASGGSLAAHFGSDAVAATQSTWTVHVVGAFDVAFSSGDVVLMEWTTPGGTYTRWQLVLIKATLRTQVIAYTPAGTPTVVIDRDGVLGGFRTWIVSAEQVGGSINVSYRLPGGTLLIGVAAGTTLGGVASMRINPTGTTSSIPMPFGHLAVWATDLVPYDVDGALDPYGDAFVHPAMTSYRYEAAHLRLARLAAEDGITLSMPAVDADAVMRMGWQPPGVFADLAAECVDVDGGLLHESGFGLGYVPRSARYNKPVDLTIDLATYAVSARGEVLDPTYDDQTIRNRWTVSRRDGSFAVADDPDSQRRGVYSDSAELNLADDARLGDQAGWRVRLGTVVDLREETFPIDLAANPGLIDGWLSCGVGSRVVRVNPPAQHRPGPLDRLVAGWTETIGPRSWMVQVMPEPAPPWDVATADGTQRAGADGSTLAAPLTESATTLQLASTAENGPWGTDPSDFPLDIRVGGEQVRASAISAVAAGTAPTVLADDFNRPAVSSGWGGGWTTSGGATSDYAATGTTGTHSVGVVASSRRTLIGPTSRDSDVTVTVSTSALAAGAAQHAAIVSRHTSVDNMLMLMARLNTSQVIDARIVSRIAGTEADLVAAPVIAGLTHAPGRQVRIRQQTIGTLIRVKVWDPAQPEPPFWHVTALSSTWYSAAGQVGARSFLFSGNTNTLPVTFTWDDFAATVGLPDVSNPAVAPLPLPLWRSTAALAGSQPVRVVVVGSSTAAGSMGTQTSLTPRRSTTMWGAVLRARSNAVAAPGGYGVPAANIGIANEWTRSGGANVTMRGLGFTSWQMSPGNTLSRPWYGDAVTILYEQGPGAGAFQVSIDGGAATTVAPNTGAAINTGTWTSSTLSVGSHTMTITAVGTCTIEAVYGHDRDTTSGVQVWNGGLPGASTYELTQTAGLVTRIGQLAPSMVVVMLTANDYASGTAPSVTKQRISDFITGVFAATAADPQILLVHQHQRFDVVSPAYPWAQYGQILQELAAADPSRVAYVDVSSIYPTSQAADTHDLIDTDSTHLTERGHQLLADALAGATANAVPGSQLVTISQRGVNGIQRSWPAGTEVNVWDEAVAPL